MLLARRRELQALLGDRFDAEVAAVHPLIAGYRDEHGCVNGLQAALRMVEELEAAGKADAVSVLLLLVVGATEVRGGGRATVDADLAAAVEGRRG